MPMAEAAAVVALMADGDEAASGANVEDQAAALVSHMLKQLCLPRRPTGCLAAEQ